MTLSDQLGDMLIRIKNATLVKKAQTNTFCSQEKENVLKVLVKQGYIRNYQVKEIDGHKALLINLSTNKQDQPFLVKRVSKPGQRIYLKAKNIYPIKGGRGCLLISTSKGIMTGQEAKKQNLGGEVIAEIN